jgi:hypothetical protein
MVSPARRWFRFSLRTTFLVVAVTGLFLACLAWQMDIVRQRRAALQNLTRGTGWFITAEEYQQIPSRPPDDHAAGRVPIWRIWLGDEPIAQIGFEPSISAAERSRVKELFPEAYVSDQ